MGLVKPEVGGDFEYVWSRQTGVGSKKRLHHLTLIRPSCYSRDESWRESTLPLSLFLGAPVSMHMCAFTIFLAAGSEQDTAAAPQEELQHPAKICHGDSIRCSRRQRGHEIHVTVASLAGHGLHEEAYEGTG